MQLAKTYIFWRQHSWTKEKRAQGMPLGFKMAVGNVHKLAPLWRIMQFASSALLVCCKMVGHLSMIQFTCQLFFLLQVWLYIEAHIYYIQPLPKNLKVGKASQLKHRKRLQTLESTWKKQERKKSWGSFLHFLLMRSATKKANLFFSPHTKPPHWSSL